VKNSGKHSGSANEDELTDDEELVDLP